MTQLLRQLHRGQTGAVQNFIGVSVADSTEKTRIRQRTFKRVVLSSQRVPKSIKGRAEDFKGAAIKPCKVAFSFDEMQGCALFRPRFGQKESSGRKVECCKSKFAGNL